jgi:hypothetical protein
MVVATNVSLMHIRTRFQLTRYRESIPDESGKDNGCNARAINGAAVAGGAPPNVAPKHSHSNPCSKPEDHREELNTSDGKLVGSTREPRRNQDQVCYCEQCPYRCKQHKVDAVRRPTSPRVGVPINN